MGKVNQGRLGDRRVELRSTGKARCPIVDRIPSEEAVGVGQNPSEPELPGDAERQSGVAEVAGALLRDSDQRGDIAVDDEVFGQGGLSGRPDDILTALRQDLLADGFLDGVGVDGQPLQFAGIPLDAFTLRSAYVNALTAFLRSGRNQSGLDASCFKRFFDEILLARSPLFPASTWINTPFQAGCASCTQLENGDFSCIAGDCGPCGRCRIDFSGETPVAACAPRDDQCLGNCAQCLPTAEDAGTFACAPQDNACGGDCSTCAADENGGFRCQADANRCAGDCGACVQSANSAAIFTCAPQPERCPGNCNQCQPSTADIPQFDCRPAPTACGGNCSTCAADTTGGFSCQPDVARCPGPVQPADRCNQCQAMTSTQFVCVDVQSLCPADRSEPVSDCVRAEGEGVCSRHGTQATRLTTYQCQSGQCLPSVSNLVVDCNRDTDGDLCGDPTCPIFGPCERVGGICSTDGLQSRTCEQPICRAERCVMNIQSETRSCGYDPTGDVCRRESCDAGGGRQGHQDICCSSSRPSSCSVECSLCER